MDVGKRIKYVRELRNKTLIEVAEYLGVTEATVQRYESGNIKNLKLDTITKISDFLDVDPSYLMGWTDVIENVKTTREYYYFPTSISAGDPITEEPVTGIRVKTIKLPDAVMGKWAGHTDLKIMRINGESMNNVIPDGSIIAIKPVEFHSLKNGDIVVFNKEYEYATKRFYNDIENKRFIFKPDSSDPAFTDHVIEYENADNLVIEGKVVLYIVELG